jgi:Protein of unknown function (DUF5132)
MSLIEDVFKGGNLLTGVGIAIGAAVIVPLVMPVLRPVAKTIIKAGLMAYDQGRVALADVTEQTGDIVAEARAEMKQLGGSSEAESTKHADRAQSQPRGSHSSA